MFRCFDEPDLDEMLADPMIRQVMAADRVERAALETLLGDAARRVWPVAMSRQRVAPCCAN